MRLYNPNSKIDVKMLEFGKNHPVVTLALAAVYLVGVNRFFYHMTKKITEKQIQKNLTITEIELP